MNLREEKFSIKRIGLLLRRDIPRGYGGILVVIGAIIALLLSFDILNFTLFGEVPRLGHHESTFSTILFIGGFILTASIFKEIHKRESAQSYIMLPASPLEKTVSRILISTVAWAFGTLLWYTAYSYLSAGITELIIGTHHYLLNPFQPDIWWSIAHYFVLQSVFLVGSIYFRKGQLFKTLLSLFVIGVVISIVVAFAVRIIFAPYFSGMFVMDKPEMIGSMFNSLPFHFSERFTLLENFGNVIYWAIIAPLGWIITYFRFREVQIKDAV